MLLDPERLEVVAQSLTAVLGVWLGLTVLTRFRTPVARVFAFLSLTLVVWSSSIIVQRLSDSASAIATAHAIEELGTALIVPAMAHLSLMVATEGHPTRRQVQVMAVAYALNLLWAFPGVIDATAPIAIEPPQLSVGAIPGAALGWARLATRLATLAIGAGWLFEAYRRTKPSDPRRRQLAVTAVAVAIGMAGGVIRLLSEITQTDPWIGLSLITLAMVVAASVVFSPGFFFPPEVAGKAFWTSLTLGLGLFLLVGALLVVDAVTRQVLGIDLPLPTILVLVVTIAVYEPVTAWVRGRVGGRTPRDIARGRLLAALGQPALTAQAADAGVQPALTRMTQALDLSGAMIVRHDGSVAATEGHVADPSTTPPIALVSQDEVVGELRLGGTLSGAPLGASDEALLALVRRIRRRRAPDRPAGGRAGGGVERPVAGARPGRFERRPPVRGTPAARVRHVGPAGLRARTAPSDPRRDLDRALGRREGRDATGPGPLRVPVRPGRARRGQGRGPRPDLARHGRGARRSCVPSHPRRASPHARPGRRRQARRPVPQRPLPAGAVGRRGVRRGRLPRAPGTGAPGTHHCRSGCACSRRPRPCIAANTSTTARSTATASMSRRSAPHCAADASTCSSPSARATSRPGIGPRPRPRSAKRSPSSVEGCPLAEAGLLRLAAV